MNARWTEVAAARWRRRERWTALVVGDAQGTAAEQLVGMWRADGARPERLHIVHVPCASPPRPARAARPDWERHDSDDGRLQRLRIEDEPELALRTLIARADLLLVCADAPVAPPRALARLAAAEARLVLPADAAAHAAWQAAGFEPEAPGILRRNGRTPVRVSPAWAACTDRSRRAVVVGAGLAGCATAHALARQGWSTLLLDRLGSAGGTALRQPVGVFHPVVHPHDTLHARFGRAAARAARIAVARAIETCGVRGDASGLLHVARDAADACAVQAGLDALGLARDRFRALDASAVSTLAGTRVEAPACWQADGGWVDPVGLAQAWLESAGSACTLSLGVAVQRLARDGDAWHLLDAQGRTLAQAATVVLANADAAARLAGSDWPVRTVRGQSSLAHAKDAAGGAPRLALAGNGYVAPTGDGGYAFGATAQPGDDTAEARLDDHLDNLRRLEALAPALAQVDAARLEGRVGWRAVMPDRLPLVGAVPEVEACGRRDVVRLVPRRDGLYVHAAHGARGIAGAALSAEVLAALIAGAPVPVASELADAIDPARFDVRARRRAAAIR